MDAENPVRSSIKRNLDVPDVTPDIELEFRIIKAKSFLTKCGYTITKEKTPVESQFSLEGLSAAGILLGVCFGTSIRFFKAMPPNTSTMLLVPALACIGVIVLIAIAAAIIIKEDNWELPMEED